MIAKSTPFTLRTAVPSDVKNIEQLVMSAYAKWIPVIGRKPGPMIMDYQEAINVHRFDLLHQEDELVALIETIVKEDHLFIENLAVGPAFQNQGLGRKLLLHAEKLSIDHGYQRICLLTNKAFESNVRFYQNFGYQLDREEPYLEGFTCYLSKSLRRPR